VLRGFGIWAPGLTSCRAPFWARADGPEPGNGGF